MNMMVDNNKDQSDRKVETEQIQRDNVNQVDLDRMVAVYTRNSKNHQQ